MYDVCLSFAGEDRNLVSEVAQELKKKKIEIFYDEYETANLWGKDLTQYLYDIYKNQSQYCVMFISKYYAEKNWTRHEYRSALNRAFIEKEEYILPVQIDNTELEGLPTTIGYISADKYTPIDIANLISEKLQTRNTMFENCNSIKAATAKALDYLIPISKSRYIQVILQLKSSEFTNGLYVIADYAEQYYKIWRLASNTGLIGKCFETGEIVICNDINNEPRYDMAFPETKSELVIPIKNKNKKIIGVVNFESTTLNTYQKEFIGKAERILIDFADFLTKKEFYSTPAKAYNAIRRLKSSDH